MGSFSAPGTNGGETTGAAGGLGGVGLETVGFCGAKAPPFWAVAATEPTAKPNTNKTRPVATRHSRNLCPSQKPRREESQPCAFPAIVPYGFRKLFSIFMIQARSIARRGRPQNFSYDKSTREYFVLPKPSFSARLSCNSPMV